MYSLCSRYRQRNQVSRWLLSWRQRWTLCNIGQRSTVECCSGRPTHGLDTCIVLPLLATDKKGNPIWPVNAEHWPLPHHHCPRHATRLFLNINWFTFWHGIIFYALVRRSRRPRLRLCAARQRVVFQELHINGVSIEGDFRANRALMHDPPPTPNIRFDPVLPRQTQQAWDIESDFSLYLTEPLSKQSGAL